ncbi:MAG: hypothetical protein AAF519_14395 [Bacteroidota bacterium]
MEFEKIKRHVEENRPVYSKTELEDIFTLRTKRSLSKINSKMFWDALFMVFSVVILVIATFMIGLKDRISISLELVGLSAFLFVHYRIKYHLLNKPNIDLSIKNSVKRSLKTLKTYLKLYQILIPTGVTALYLKIQWDLWFIMDWSTPEITLRSTFSILIFVLIWMVTKKLIRVMYIPQTIRLHELISELD